MEDMLIMSKTELNRKTILEAYINGKLTLLELSKKIRVSYRQAKRILKKYKEEGDKGLQHKNRGRKPHNHLPLEYKKLIINLYETKYLGFGPTFASEKIFEDDGYAINPETLRKWLKQAGLWVRKRKFKIYRERRERRPNFGDMLQIDGSIHRWFDKNEECYCLLNIVDDATGITLAALDTGETTKILLFTFKRWIEKYGIPKSVYVDLKSVYVSPKRLKEKYDDDLLIKDGFSVFEQVCKALNIEIIRAYSAEAKGRVERKHAVFQDRFVKELRLYGIKTIEEANQYLENKFLDNINNKFAKITKDMIDAHRDPQPYGDLNQILCWKYKRQLKNDWTIQFKRQYFQIEQAGSQSLKPGIKITIKIYLNGKMAFWHEKNELYYYPLAVKPEPPSKSKKYYIPKGYDPVLRSILSRKNKHKSPWSKSHPNCDKSIKKVS